MKIWLPIIISCWLLAGCASTKDSPPSTGAASPKVSDATQAAGDYAGQWTSSDGGTGKLSLSLKKQANSPWEAKVSFTFEGDEVPTITKSIEVNGTHVLLTDEFEDQGNKRDVELTGDLAGDILQGTYKFTMGDGKPGTWKANRKE
jgi:major membrane immunogen (membrane-anchored lipoprotein)